MVECTTLRKPVQYQVSAGLTSGPCGSGFERVRKIGSSPNPEPRTSRSVRFSSANVAEPVAGAINGDIPVPVKVEPTTTNVWLILHNLSWLTLSSLKISWMSRYDDIWNGLRKEVELCTAALIAGEPMAMSRSVATDKLPNGKEGEAAKRIYST
ncbi:hypothetical protein B0H17DRAFT_1138254 [Mycena rosella]|uniref:Uncharacterized protein n=1 Tax=Mycena rosella TaxID=1033263 RepID=A0AAD7D6M6_MYCRO|nr:hypothetical protein B0H17DRAFT_1138254 [Mycena rosella]